MQLLHANLRTLTQHADNQDHATDIVPLSQRRSPITLGLLWITMVTGFPTVMIGFEWYKSGLTLPQVMQCIVVSCIVIMAYCLPSAYLGAKSGQTYGLLSRRIFGKWGSRLVSFNLVWISVLWYGLTACFLADGLKGIYNIPISTLWLAPCFAILMAFNNFFGFSGIANFARYLAAPVLIGWVGYAFFHATSTCPTSVLFEQSHVAFPKALTMVSCFVVGFATWGNEADYWRYAKPNALLAAWPLLISLIIGQVMFPITGWMMARITGVTEIGAATKLMNDAAFGGITIIAAAALIITYFAVNDSGLYAAINGIENLKELPRKFVVIGLALAGALAAAGLSFNSHAFEMVASTSSALLPSATVIMLAEYFWLGKRAGVNFSSVASFAEVPTIRWQAVVALLVAATVGALTSGLTNVCPAIGVCSLQSWLAAFVVYTTLRIAFRRSDLGNQRRWLERIMNRDPAESPAN